MKCVALLIIAVATVTARQEPPSLNEKPNETLPAALGSRGNDSFMEYLKEQLAEEKTLKESLRKKLAAKDLELGLAYEKIRNYEQTIIAAVRARATIEYAEDLYGYGYNEHIAETRRPTKTAPTLRTLVTTLKPKVTLKPEEKKTPHMQFEWSKQRRIKVWVWILTYRSSDRIVQQLIGAIEDKDNKIGPNTVEEFAECIANAYSILSTRIHNYLIGAVADKIYWDLALDECENRALKILLNVLQLKAPSRTL